MSENERELNEMLDEYEGGIDLVEDENPMPRGVGRKELYTCSMPCERRLLKEFGIYRLVEPRIGAYRVPIKFD